MLVKGQIVDQVVKVVDGNYQLTNRYNVRVPIFEAQGSNEKAVIECGLIFQPGTNSVYKPDDVVILSFENNCINDGFILGKLYTEEAASEQNSESNPFNLDVKNSASLPKNTTINGINVFDSLTNIKNDINGLNNCPLYSHNISIVTLSIGDTYPKYSIRLGPIVDSKNIKIETSDSLMSKIREKGTLPASGWWKTDSSTVYQIYAIGIVRILQVNKLVAYTVDDDYFQLPAFPFMTDTVTQLI